MVVGEGLFVTSFLTLQAALKHVILPFLIRFNPMRISNEKMVVGEGFEPSKSVTADLQSAPFGRSGTPPYTWLFNWPCLRERCLGKRGASYQMKRMCKVLKCRK